MSQEIRMPAVAGQFYRGEPQQLKKQVEQYIDHSASRIQCKGLICPHAGFMYSGHVAGAVYSRVIIPETVILLGPNHTGLGEKASVMVAGRWEMPGGMVPINEELASKLVRGNDLLTESVQGHFFEHSLEVQLPFLTYFRQDIEIVPITFMYQSIEKCRNIGKIVAETVEPVKDDVLIIASSDMSHYISDTEARKKDNLAIEKILDLDPEGLYDVVNTHDISMCGFIPATIMLYATRTLGARSAELIKYATSGEVSGDFDHVVGYAGVLVK